MTTDELPTLNSAAGLKGLTIANATATANARAAALKDGQAGNGEADVVVVLAHEDAAIFGQQFSGDVDAVVAGHTHVPYAQKVRTTAGTEIPVVQPDHYGLKLGDITLTVARGADGRAKVTASQARNIDLAASDCAAADATEPYGVAATVADAQRKAEEAGDQVLATLGSDYLRGTDDGADTGANRSTESTASDLIADSFRDWLANDIAPAGDHYVGLMNPGGVRADYGKGELTQGEAYQVQPFGNEIAYATYTGKQVKQVLAEQFQPTTSRAALILGVSSNVQVVLDQQAADTLEQAWDQIKNQGVDAATLEGQVKDAASRVVSAVYVDGEPLADDAKVVIASNSFLLGGGDSFTTLKEAPMVNTGILDRDITAKFLAGRSAEGNTASYLKRQVGADVQLAGDASAAVVRLTGLSFSAAAEQVQRDAAASVEAVVAMADGSRQTLMVGDVDRSVTAGLPETGRVTLAVSAPQGAATQPCAGGSGQCAVVRLVVVGADGSRSELPQSVELAAAGADGAAGAGAVGEDGQAVGAAGTAGTPSASALARTGASLAGLVLASGLTAAGIVLLARRRA